MINLSWHTLRNIEIDFAPCTRGSEKPKTSEAWLGKWLPSNQVQILALQDVRGCYRHANWWSTYLSLIYAYTRRKARWQEDIYKGKRKGVSHILVWRRSRFRESLTTLKLILSGEVRRWTNNNFTWQI